MDSQRQPQQPHQPRRQPTQSSPGGGDLLTLVLMGLLLIIFVGRLFSCSLIRPIDANDLHYMTLCMDITKSFTKRISDFSGLLGDLMLPNSVMLSVQLSYLDEKLFRVLSEIGIHDGTYSMKKVLIQSEEQLALMKEEIRVSSLFSHPNLLPLLDHAVIEVKGAQERNHEAYLLFPIHLDGTLLDTAKTMQSKKEYFSTANVLQIFRQLCAGLQHMHNYAPSYAHNDVKPGNVLITHRKGQAPLAILMDFGSAQPARKEIRSRSEAVQLQNWAAEHCSAPFRAPELWDCPSYADIDQRTDVWSLGCTLYAIMYGESPFEYALDEAEGTPPVAIMNAQVKWPSGPNPPYPELLHQFVMWMLQPQPAVRPFTDDIIIHVDKLISKFSS